MSEKPANPWISTASLCDQFGDYARVLDLPLFAAGTEPSVSGRCFPVAVKAGRKGLAEMLTNLASPSETSVLIVDVAGVRDQVYVDWAEISLAAKKFAGLVVLGAVRRGAALRAGKNTMKRVFATDRNPRTAPKDRGTCSRAIIDVAGVKIASDDYIAIDMDGAVVVDRELLRQRQIANTNQQQAEQLSSRT